MGQTVFQDNALHSAGPAGFAGRHARPDLSCLILPQTPGTLESVFRALPGKQNKNNLSPRLHTVDEVQLCKDFPELKQLQSAMDGVARARYAQTGMLLAAVDGAFEIFKSIGSTPTAKEQLNKFHRDEAVVFGIRQLSAAVRDRNEPLKAMTEESLRTLARMRPAEVQREMFLAGYAQILLEAIELLRLPEAVSAQAAA